jgi:outer membrane protein assembly factor BamA
MVKNIFLLIFILLISAPAISQIDLSQDQAIRIDSIQISLNWRTKAHIIEQELGFKTGDMVNIGMLDTMLIRVWNIGNFARVDYTLDTILDGKILLNVLAKDAFTIVPAFSFSGNRQDWSLGMGISDDNFLGRNINFNIGGAIGTNARNFNMSITVPRQLLYKNMSVSGGVLIGQGTNYRYKDREKVSMVAYSKRQISGGISNPWNQDFNYRFSPNFGWSIFQHDSDSSLNDSETPFAGTYKVNYLSLSLGESLGYINKKRHQKDGYNISLGVGAGIGLDENSPLYYSIGYNMEYYKLFNKVVQFSSEFSTGYTSSTIPSLLFYKGAGDVKGILTGEISGQSYYTAYVGWHFTYFNRDWFAMEQSVYVNWGNGNDSYAALYNTKPLYGVGTGLRFNIPQIPWMGFRLFFTYSGKNSNWFGLQI